MRDIIFRSVLFLAIACFPGPVTAIAGDQPDLTGEEASLSYSIGYQVGGDFRRQGVEIDPQILVQGVRDALLAEEPSMSPEEMRSVLTDLNTRIAAARLERGKQMAADNLAEGRKFLETNRGRDTVFVRPSGLQYEVLRQGEGKGPAGSDSVTVHYRGTLIDGTEFDSSYKRSQPATFRLNQVIKGWTEGLQLMKPGAKYMFFIPSELAYGERGTGGAIGPNSTLIFEVELLSVNGG